LFLLPVLALHIFLPLSVYAVQCTYCTPWTKDL
jgi:hypothetical protein